MSDEQDPTTIPDVKRAIRIEGFKVYLGDKLLAGGGSAVVHEPEVSDDFVVASKPWHLAFSCTLRLSRSSSRKLHNFIDSIKDLKKPLDIAQRAARVLGNCKAGRRMRRRACAMHRSKASREVP